MKVIIQQKVISRKMMIFLEQYTKLHYLKNNDKSIIHKKNSTTNETFDLTNNDTSSIHEKNLSTQGKMKYVKKNLKAESYEVEGEKR